MRPCASSRQRAGITPKVKTEPELESPSDDEEDGDGDVVGIEGRGSGPGGAMGEWPPPTDDAVDPRAETGMLVGGRRIGSTRSPSPTDTDWLSDAVARVVTFGDSDEMVFGSPLVSSGEPTAARVGAALLVV
jgi:hypothetical protein